MSSLDDDSTPGYEIYSRNIGATLMRRGAFIVDAWEIENLLGEFIQVMAGRKIEHQDASFGFGPELGPIVSRLDFNSRIDVMMEIMRSHDIDPDVAKGFKTLFDWVRAKRNPIAHSSIGFQPPEMEQGRAVTFTQLEESLRKPPIQVSRRRKQGDLDHGPAMPPDAFEKIQEAYTEASRLAYAAFVFRSDPSSPAFSEVIETVSLDETLTWSANIEELAAALEPSTSETPEHPR